MINPYQTPNAEIKITVTQSQESTSKIWSVIALALATFCGGILAGSFLLLTNLEHQSKKIEGILFIAAATIVTIFSLFFALFSPIGLVPTLILLNFVEAVLILLWAVRFQANFFDQHEIESGLYYSNSRAMFLGMITSVAVYGMLLLASLMYARMLSGKY